MTKLECIIRPDRLDKVKETLDRFGHHGMTVSQVMGCGSQRGWTEVYRGVETPINLLPKVKVEVVLKDEEVEQVVQLICEAAQTGEIGDGKIFIYPVANAVRIRTREAGESAL
ncbi:MAG: P-II family nitrogen regulator [Firmicutes bacterium]|nr:P-II family nitrogen regulator [Bacillota bacterium]